MDRLFVANKPINISSNRYLGKIKRKYGVKKAGFSGTLDPFACGSLIVAFGKYTQLFRYLKKTPKSYRATIWLGANSDSLDNENVTIVEQNPKMLNENSIKEQLKNLVGELKYLPPKYSAKQIGGKRAYDLARANKEFKLNQITSFVYDVKFINYNHPFISFEIKVSEGSYIRSIAQILLKKLKVIGTLSYLERLCEGKFKFNNEIALNPLEYLDIKKNNYSGSKKWVELGKKLSIDYFENKDDGKYLIVFDDFFSIIEIKDLKVIYLLNKVVLNG